MKVALLACCALLVTVSATGGDPAWTSRYVMVTATGYDPGVQCCGKYADGKTATNTNAWCPGVAVDPTVIPLGARLDIPGYPRSSGTWILADDVGSAIVGKTIDVRFKTRKEALKWGRKKLRVRVWVRVRE